MAYEGDLITKQILRGLIWSWFSFEMSNVSSLTFNFPMPTVGIKKKSRVPGVMITQFIETLPEGKSHPDFTRKPIALTIQEGKIDSIRIILNINITKYSKVEFPWFCIMDPWLLCNKPVGAESCHSTPRLLWQSDQIKHILTLI